MIPAFASPYPSAIDAFWERKKKKYKKPKRRQHTPLNKFLQVLVVEQAILFNVVS